MASTRRAAWVLQEGNGRVNGRVAILTDFLLFGRHLCGCVKSGESRWMQRGKVFRRRGRKWEDVEGGRRRGMQLERVEVVTVEGEVGLCRLQELR